MIIFHAESVKVPVNCTLTSASELEAALPKELLPISALGKRIHHCRPRETAKSFPELPAAKSPCSPPPLFFLLFLFFPPSEGEARAGAGLFLFSVGLAKTGWWLLQRAAWGVPGCVPPHRLGSVAAPHPGTVAPVPAGHGRRRGDRGVSSIPGGWGPLAPGLLLGLTRGSGLDPLLSAPCWLCNAFVLLTGASRELLGAWSSTLTRRPRARSIPACPGAEDARV